MEPEFLIINHSPGELILTSRRSKIRDGKGMLQNHLDELQWRGPRGGEG